ncbi:hypothetical protein C0991_002534 [Blastosporella zonata]|nr:hypothetical protein C0991_002534 [Blastosporella zonata]
MATDTTFLSHYNTALSWNLMLKGTDLFLDDRAFINQLKAAIPNKLFSHARDKGLTREYNLKAFKAGLVEVDKRQLNDRKQIRDEAEDIAQKHFGSVLTVSAASALPKAAYSSNTTERNRTKPVAAFIDPAWQDDNSADDKVAAVLPSAVIEDASDDLDPMLND